MVFTVNTLSRLCNCFAAGLKVKFNLVRYTNHGQKILVIEDDKDIRETITYALEEHKFEVVSSEDAKILRSLDKIKPDLILLDNWLTDWKSDANGQQLSKELKTNPKTSHIPVVIVSAVSNIKEIAEAGQADAYLKKPFDLTELIAVVTKFSK